MPSASLVIGGKGSIMLEKFDAVRVIEQMIDNLNRGNLAEALAAFAEDVLIVDDIPPFRRSGIIGAEAMLKSVITTWRRLDGSLNLDAPVRCEVGEDQAYVVAPFHFHISSSSVSGEAVGLLTFTLRSVEDSLLIDTAIVSSAS
jgi:ketosteroid isomerase-like protein